MLIFIKKMWETAATKKSRAMAEVAVLTNHIQLIFVRSTTWGIVKNKNEVVPSGITSKRMLQ